MTSDREYRCFDPALAPRWLNLARFGWFLLAIATLTSFTLALPGYWSGFIFDTADRVNSPVLGAVQITGSLASIIAAMLSLLLAGLIFWRKSNDRMALYVSAYLLVYSVVMAGPMEALEVVYPQLRGFTVDYLQPLLMAAPTVVLFFIFPTGRIQPAMGRWVILASLGWSSLMLVVPLNSVLVLTDPITVIFGIAWILSLPVAGVAAQIYRYRRVSSTAEKEQTKWVVFGLTLWVALIIAQSFPYSILGSIPEGGPIPWWAPISRAGWWLSLTITPISLAISILRYRLWDIDLIIRRTLQYALLTGLLALVYFGGVVVLQWIVRPLTGSDNSPLVTVITTLGIAALFNPLRHRIQDFIDRRFYRKKYDSELTLSHFAVTARDEVDMDRLNDALLHVVSETMHPEQTTLWLVTNQENRQNL